MEPKIDSVIKGPNGHRATVSGPINWDVDETSATFAAAITEVLEDGTMVLAAGQNPHKFTRAQDGRWSAEVQVIGDRQLQDGTCNGWATASVLEATGAYEAYPWEVDNLTITGDMVAPRS